MRIASFNVENLTDRPSADVPLAARLDILRPQLERLDADILCLQEVDASKDPAGGGRRLSALETLLDPTGYSAFHTVCTVRPDTGRPRDKHNLVVLSRWPIGRHAQYANDLVPAPVYRRTTTDMPGDEPSRIEWDRPILHAEIDLPGGRPLHVLNMHLRAPLAAHVPGQKTGPFAWKSVGGWAEGYFLAAVKRSGQALEARMAVDRIFDDDPQAMVALAGDFNAEEREVPLRLVMGDIEDTGNGRLANRSLVPLEHSLAPDRRYTVIHRGRRLMLDHLLVSRALMGRYRAIEVHNEALGDELVAYTLVDAAPDSYHAPVVAAFDMGQ
ncbi:MAG: endonuclease/exonuclease/phosphatase family protein [Hyphomicrobiales bacterium]